MTCGKILAPGQWWHFCGETDMGQTLPVQCTECGGDMVLAPPEEQERAARARAERLAELDKQRSGDASNSLGWYSYTGEGRKEISTFIGDGLDSLLWTKNKTAGYMPQSFMYKQPDGTWKFVENPDYVEPPPDEPNDDDDDDVDWQGAGAWVIPAPYGQMMLTAEQRPAWWRRTLVRWATGWKWEDAQ